MRNFIWLTFHTTVRSTPPSDISSSSETSGSEQTTSTITGTTGGPVTQQGSPGERTAANTQGYRDGVSHGDATLIGEDIGHQKSLKKSFDETTATLESMDQATTNANMQDITEKLLNALQEMFSSLGDMFSKSSTLGLQGKSNPFSSGTKSAYETYGTDAYGSNEDVLQQCRVLSPLYTAVSKADRTNPYIAEHSSMRGPDRERNLRFIKDNCLVQGKSVQGFDYLIKMSSRGFFDLVTKFYEKGMDTALAAFLSALSAAAIAINLATGGVSTPILAFFLGVLSAAIVYFQSQINRFLSFELKNVVNSATIGYQIEYLFEHIFKQNINFSSLNPGKKFKYNNQIFTFVTSSQIKLVKANGGGEIILNKDVSSPNLFQDSSGKYKIELSDNSIVILDGEDEYSMDYLLGENESDPSSLPPLDTKEKNKKLLLLSNLYTLLGTEEYENYAKLQGSEFNAWSYEFLGDRGGGRRTALLTSESGINTRVLQKLWRVSTLNQLARLKNMPSKLEKPSSFDEVLQFRNYKSMGDRTNIAFNPTTGALDLENLASNSQEILAILSEDIDTFANLIPKSVDELKSADLEKLKDIPLLSSQFATKKMAQIHNVVSKTPGLSRLVFGDNSMQEYILGIIASDQSGLDENDPNKLESADYDSVQNILLNSDKYDYFRDNIGYDMMDSIGATVIAIRRRCYLYSWTSKENFTRTGIAPLTLVIGTLDGITTLMKTVNKLKTAEKDNIIDKYLCEEYFENKWKTRIIHDIFDLTDRVKLNYYLGVMSLLLIIQLLVILNYHLFLLIMKPIDHLKKVILR